ncbi:hypothetical protein [Nocardia stercoris]|uniref:Uncharacterized protein n=1 Tax=Nocardia stercoris TaxID=2483361 RepID=A0A3M2LER7_9NOCA|nr:hypothetical protein [Nocardia stercoris]RMI35270.1 hypothetical protein EBN03_03000 [Nocardia stercoris]
MGTGSGLVDLGSALGGAASSDLLTGGNALVSGLSSGLSNTGTMFFGDVGALLGVIGSFSAVGGPATAS